MNIRFVAPDPHSPAREVLDAVLEAGTDQIAIACAFLSMAGVEILRRHAPRIASSDSYVVVAWAPSTDQAAVLALHNLIPGKVFLHLGYPSPIENKVGCGLMHSKVVFARTADRCLVWTGSHNLTASAFQGVNCEAAVLLEGVRGDSPIEDALTHLRRCREEAVPYNPQDLPPIPGEGGAAQVPAGTLVIHAEGNVGDGRMPEIVHVRLPNIDYDSAAKPPADAWLYLYQPGVLRSFESGGLGPKPNRAFSGVITALNFTESHPRYPGALASWDRANAVIYSNGEVFQLGDPPGLGPAVSQCALHLKREESLDTIWLASRPSLEWEKTLAKPSFMPVDPDLLQFFDRSSRQATALIRRPVASIDAVLRIRASPLEIGSLTCQELGAKLRIPEHVKLDLTRENSSRYIYRAYYRLDTGDAQYTGQPNGSTVQEIGW